MSDTTHFKWKRGSINGPEKDEATKTTAPTRYKTRSTVNNESQESSTASSSDNTKLSRRKSSSRVTGGGLVDKEEKKEDPPSPTTGCIGSGGAAAAKVVPERLRKRDIFVRLIIAGVTIFCLISAWGLQRNGLMIHGESWHLANHHSESMIKKALLFRNLVYTIHQNENLALQKDSTKQNRWLQRAFPFVNKEFVDYFAEMSKMTENATSHFENINEKIKVLKPSHLFDEGVTTPFVNLGDIEDLFTNYPNTVGKNTLIIIFPGVLSEFIEVGTFEDLFTASNIGGNKIMEEFYQMKEQHNDPKNLVDRVFSTELLSYNELPLENLIEVASVKFKNLDRAFDVLRLKSPMGSLETLGTEEESMECYMRRLDKYFKIMKTIPERIHLIGYSRGALVALELLKRSRERVKQHPWAIKIRSMISLGGVMWGTEVADTTRQFGHANKKTMDLLLNASRALDYSHFGDMGTYAHVKEVAFNTKVIAGLAISLANADFPKAHPSLDDEFPAAPDVEFGGLAKLMHAFMFKHFRLNDPVGDYYGNIKTMKILVDKMTAAVEGLTTEARLKWWTINSIPSDVKYYTIAATMQDAEADVHMVERDVAFSVNSVDFRFNRQFYYDSYVLTGKMLHDGQMSVDRTAFWSSLHRSLNPKQNDYHCAYLAILNAHHWGLALPAALDNPVLKKNAFPRTTLLKALGAFLVRD